MQGYQKNIVQWQVPCGGMNMAPLNSLHAHRTVFGVADPYKDHSLVLRTHPKARPAGIRVLRTPRSK